MLAGFPKSKPPQSRVVWPQGQGSRRPRVTEQTQSPKEMHSVAQLTLHRLVGKQTKRPFLKSFVALRPAAAQQARPQESSCLASSQASAPSGLPRPLPWLTSACSESEPLCWTLAGFDQVVIFLHDPFFIFLYKKGINCTWLQEGWKK